MKMKIARGSKESRNSLLSFLCAFVYYVSYITRANFAAILAAIIADGVISKSTGGMVVTVSFICYGVGQLISGWLGDKFNPKSLMTLGLTLTATMNILITFCTNGIQMCFVWGINGLAQSLLWPPMVKIMSSFMSTERYNKSCVLVNWGSYIGMITIYLMSPVVISKLGWKPVFYITAGCGLLMSIIWFTAVSAIEKRMNIEYHNGKKQEHGSLKFDLLPGIILTLIMTAIFLQGTLRDGVTTWVPTYISEVFHLGSELSILSGIAIPVFSLVAIRLTLLIFKKSGNQPLSCSFLFFISASVGSTLLILFSGMSAVLAIVLFAFIVGCMNGINLILTGFFPAMYAKPENVSLLSGVLNFMTYLGSAASTYGFAVLSDCFGWNGTIVFWIVLSLLGAAVCMIAYFYKKRAAASF